MKPLLSDRRPLLFGTVVVLAGGLALFAPRLSAQGLGNAWSGYGHDPQHTAVSQNASQPLQAIRWTTKVDLAPNYSNGSLLTHYGSPLVTAANTVIVPVRKADERFLVEAHRGNDGALLWSENSDYITPNSSWRMPMNPTLTARQTICYPVSAGRVMSRSNPDAAVASSNTFYFYDKAAYDSAPAVYRDNVRISTPLTADRYGNLYFGFNVTTPGDPNDAAKLKFKSGIARISFTGAGTFVEAATAAGDGSVTQPAFNCAPALNRDHSKLYIAVRGNGTPYLLMLDARTLKTLGKAPLRDAGRPGNVANVSNLGTASPTVGPDGDVFYGVLENPFPYNHARGWLLHFSGDLKQSKTPGAFGWDDTASIVPATLMPSYKGKSPYLLMVKYNNYAGFAGGDGVNRIALLDPNVTQIDAVSGATVMKEAAAMPGQTPDTEFLGDHPNAVREWCINTAAIDPFNKCILANCEDGILYRWDLKTNTFTQKIRLTDGIGEAYTPTIIGVDGTVYAINNASLFAVGYRR